MALIMLVSENDLLKDVSLSSYTLLIVLLWLLLSSAKVFPCSIVSKAVEGVLSVGVLQLLA